MKYVGDLYRPLVAASLSRLQQSVYTVHHECAEVAVFLCMHDVTCCRRAQQESLLYLVVHEVKKTNM